MKEIVILFFIVSLLAGPSLGFVQRARILGSLEVPSYSNPQRFRSSNMFLFKSNETSADEETHRLEYPHQTLMEFWGSSVTTSGYRTFLLTGALFGSRSIREFLGLPGCFLVASLVFLIYFYETKFNYLVDIVTPERQAALKAIRHYKTEQLSSPSSSSYEKTDLKTLLDAYEKALRNELAARVVVPPNLWVIEMDPNQEDRAAAPQFLGLEITDKYTLEPVKK